MAANRFLNLDALAWPWGASNRGSARLILKAVYMALKRPFACSLFLAVGLFAQSLAAQDHKPPSGIKPWVSKSEPIVCFRTDDGKVYLEQFHDIDGVYDEETQTLSVKVSDGTIAITGPGAWELTEQLCPGKVTMVRTDGHQITSVEFAPDERDREEGVSKD
jgi:hypothetical protein